MIEVLTGPEWLLEMFDGHWNDKKTACIKPTRDADNRPILGISLLQDTSFDLSTVVTSPDGITKPAADWLERIPYNPAPMPEDDFESV